MSEWARGWDGGKTGQGTEVMGNQSFLVGESLILLGTGDRSI